MADIRQTASKPNEAFISNTPRNEFLGYLADFLAQGYSPERTQQAQGVASFLGIPAISETLNRMSYGQPLTTGSGGLGGTTRLRPETMEAALAISPFLPKGIKMTEGLPVGASIKDVSGYMASHRPMTIEGGASTLDNLIPSFGEDIYGKNALQYFGSGNIALDKQALNIFQKVKGNPNAMVTVYRAVPKNVEQKSLNAGDWVTVSKDYAKQHGESTLGNNYKLVEQKVPASALTTNADSILEQGYYPSNQNITTEIIQSPQQAALDLAQQKTGFSDFEQGLQNFLNLRIK